MALCFFALMFCAGSLRAAPTYSDQTKISLNLTNVQLEEVFDAIRGQSEFEFFYSNDNVNTKQKVSVNVRNAKIDEVMDKVLPNAYEYKVEDRYVMISAKPETPSSAKSKTSAPAPQSKNKKVSGVVTDDSGEPLPGATVQIKGTTTGVITGPNGEFIIEVPEKCDLIVKYIGMEDTPIAYTGQESINVKMKSNEAYLDDVTVVAFSKQKKESVLASISTVDTKELKVPSSNLTTAFAGRVAGLISYQTSGEPGQDNASFFIRGITTFGSDAKKDPLILIDGVELGTEDLARLNTDDIASFSVMKDATATAMYGSRAANGVIYVTTKEGREGKVKVNVRLENSFSSNTQNIELADNVTYMKMQNEAIKTRNPLALPEYNAEKITMTERGTYSTIFPDVDWNSTLFNKVATNQRGNISLSGGGTVVRYYVAVNYARDNGNVKVDQRNSFNSNLTLNKISFRSNVNIKLTKTTDLNLRMSSSFDDYQGPLSGGSDLYNKVMQANPVKFLPYYEPDEHYSYIQHIAFGNYGTGNYLNPYAEVQKGYKQYSKNTSLTQFEVKQDLKFITDGLTARAMLNLNRYSYYYTNRQYTPYLYGIKDYSLSTGQYSLSLLNADASSTPTTVLSVSSADKTITNTLYLESAVEYNQTFGKNTVGGLLVYTLNNRLTDTGTYDLLMSLPHRNMGVSGRFSYNYDSRYFSEFDFGYNGSERFAKGHRWGFFPSVGVAWMISNEQFFKPAKNVVKTLKLKGTYGKVGNDDVSGNARFIYKSSVDLSSGDRTAAWGTDLSSVNGISISQYPNEDIGWEISNKFNGGFELELVNGLSANVDLYKEVRSNIVLLRTMPYFMGLSGATPYANSGKAKGQGVDLELNYEKVINKDFWVNGRGTFTYATSEVLEWDEPDYANTPWRKAVGHSINRITGYVAERLFVDDEEAANSPQQFGSYGGGDIKYLDINNDGVINENDQTTIGYPSTPEIVYGFGLSAGYKGFDFSFFFQGTGRVSFLMNYTSNTPFFSQGQGRNNALLQAIADDYWSESNPNPYAFWPRLVYNNITGGSASSGYTNNSQASTWFLQNGSYLRLKSVEIGYTIPQSTLRKLHMNGLRVYVSGTNLLTWSAFKLWDPEMGSSGLGYPLQRVINLGVNIDL